MRRSKVRPIKNTPLPTTTQLTVHNRGVNHCLHTTGTTVSLQLKHTVRLRNKNVTAHVRLRRRKFQNYPLLIQVSTFIVTTNRQRRGNYVTAISDEPWHELRRWESTSFAIIYWRRNFIRTSWPVSVATGSQMQPFWGSVKMTWRIWCRCYRKFDRSEILSWPSYFLGNFYRRALLFPRKCYRRQEIWSLTVSWKLASSVGNDYSITYS